MVSSFFSFKFLELTTNLYLCIFAKNKEILEMNISYNWLKKYINVDVPAEELSAILTSIGLEVGKFESVQSVKGGLQGLVIGEVLTCKAHENSDHLHVTEVSVGTEEPLQIVCGAPNVAVGQKVVVATIGAKLFPSEGGEFVIKRSKIRGVESFGMLCAEDEIGIGTDHNGIIVLPEEAKVGTLAADYYNVENDVVFEVDITPNRSDAISHFGVARDVAAYFASRDSEIKLHKPDISAFKVDNNDLKVEVIVENGVACPRYSGLTISGVEVKDSPAWLKNNLLAIGIRPINNIVDATNYVLHALGQPLHAFDADKLIGNKVIVKNLEAGTKFVTLDGEERTLRAEDLMICNAEEGMCIAGVFGGQKSGITEETKNVFLESAYFNPVSIRKTARVHGLNTDASFRYERGCNPSCTVDVLKYAALLIQEIAGGKISCDVVDVYPKEILPARVELTYQKINSLIGMELEKEVVKSILRGLEMTFVSENEDGLVVDVPTYRVDVQRDVDVIEDLLRIYGYNQVPMGTSVKSSISYSSKKDSWKLQNLISEQLTANGFREIMNNSLTKLSYYTNSDVYLETNCVKIMNPLGVDLSVMRQTLLFGGLESIAYNKNRKNSNLKFYEFGNCYYFDAEESNSNALNRYNEDFHLALFLTGNKAEQSWVAKEEKTTFFELKAHLMNVFVRLGVKKTGYVMESYSNSIFAEALKFINKKGVQLAVLGKLESKTLQAFDIDGEVFFADVNWTNLLNELTLQEITYQDIPKFPEVKRDLALLIDKSVTFQDIEKIAYETERKLLKDVNLFDVYEGKNLPVGKKSYAVSFILQDAERTLKDNQIDAIVQKLIKNLTEKLGAVLR